jgi:hypothetical protein
MASAPESSLVAPRPSSRVPAVAVPSDGDSWVEKLTVVEGTGNTLVIRSYFRNVRTRERVWDEPPSGASHIRYATPDMHGLAQERLNELKSTLAMIPNDIESDDDDNNIQEASPKSAGRKGFFGMFRNGKASQKKSSIRKKEVKRKDDEVDLNLQKAIARSVMDFSKKDQTDTDSAERVASSYHPEMTDEDAIAVATALSLSEPTSNLIAPADETEEEKMLQQAMEESRRQAQAEIDALTSALAASTAGVSSPADSAKPSFKSEPDESERSQTSHTQWSSSDGDVEVINGGEASSNAQTRANRFGGSVRSKGKK